jgi:hypothetical protein
VIGVAWPYLDDGVAKIVVSVDRRPVVDPSPWRGHAIFAPNLFYTLPMFTLWLQHARQIDVDGDNVAGQ